MWHWALTVAAAMRWSLPLPCSWLLWSMTGNGMDGGPRMEDSGLRTPDWGRPAVGDGAEPLNQLPTADFWHSLSDSDNYSERLLRRPLVRLGFWFAEE